MKPVYLKMQYFGPYAHAEIDFSQLNEASVFLISGDTGAGKSTIFDAMTYALFGSTTNNRKADNLRSQFASPQQTTEVIFVFEQGQQLYRVVRHPEQQRAAKRGGGLTQAKTTANLAVVESALGGEIDVLGTKPKDVGDQIHNLLHLDADQFKKIILLPQNNFAQFLKADTNKKEELLKNIFGTKIYTDFREALKVKLDDLEQQQKTAQDKMDSLLEAPLWDDGEKEQLQTATRSQQQSVLQAIIDTRQQSQIKKQQKVQSLQATLEQHEQQRQAAEKLQQTFDQQKKLQKEYQTKVLAQQSDFDRNQQRLAALNWASQFRDLRQNEQRLQPAIEMQEAQLVTLQAVINDDQGKLKQALGNLQSLEQEASVQADRQQQVQQIQSILREAELQERQKQKRAEQAPHIHELQHLIQKKQTALMIVKQQLSQVEVALSTRVQLQQQHDLFQNLQLLFQDLKNLNAQVHQQEETVARANQLLEQTQKKSLEQQQQVHDAENEYQGKQTQRRALMIEMLQSELKTGEPCLVCGSLEHPKYAAHTEAKSQTALRDALDALDDAQNLVERTKTELAHTQVQLVELRQKKFDEEKNLATQRASFQAAYKHFLDQPHADLKWPAQYDEKQILTDLSHAQAMVAEQLTALQEQIERQQKLKQTQEQLQSSLQNDQTALTKFKATRDEAQDELQRSIRVYGELPAGSDLETERKILVEQSEVYAQAVMDAKIQVDEQKQHENLHQSQFKAQQSTLKEKQAELQQVEAKLQAAVKEEDAKTRDEAELVAWIDAATSEELMALTRAVQTFEQDQQRLDEALKGLKTALQSQVEPDLDKLRSVENDCKQQVKIAEQAQTLAQQAVQAAQEIQTQLNVLEKQQNQHSDELMDLRRLYQVINGQANHDNKLKLETYVVQQYLKIVLEYANHHYLNLLSNNRYQLEISQQPRTKQRDTGLDIDVYDNETGQIRSSETLSGGETFISSLAIALALSEIVQNSAQGVQIEALFIDEGFGSLDQETLEKALDALEMVSANRMVGVISHVSEMKNRIGQQILIQKMGDGQSQISLKGV
ncbi:sbcC protein [Weissella kandleri]|uniref:Nuclease SbcCD subunit C n=1 Tax=Weissella kandleri TaxID=1616 RepID=A0A0R2JC73_9LACO|nr:SMC family ATPase [Weissella kandleri]KRN74849.1 sbcC protein [Weissella kandleri]